MEENLSAIHSQAVAVDEFCQKKTKPKPSFSWMPRGSSLSPDILLLGTSLSHPPQETTLHRARSGGSFGTAPTTRSMVALMAVTTPARFHPSTQPGHAGTWCTQRSSCGAETGHRANTTPDPLGGGKGSRERQERVGSNEIQRQKGFSTPLTSLPSGAHPCLRTPR